MTKKLPVHPPGFSYRAPFKEPLPTSCTCPDGKAVPTPEGVLMRFVGPDEVSEVDFWSHIRNGDPYQANRPCDYVGCSFHMPTISLERMDELRAFPKIADKTALAYVAVGGNTGLSKTNNKGHVNIWFYENFEPEDAILQVIDVHTYVPA